MRENGDPRDSLLPQPGQYDSYNPKFHPLPGEWAKQQLEGKVRKKTESSRQKNMHPAKSALEKARSQVKKAEHASTPLSIKRKQKQTKKKGKP
jgi:hypothetical protein